MDRRNLTRFYRVEYDKALANFDNGDKEAANDICCDLVSDFQCPRTIQIQAWQLRSECTDDYWLAKDHLTSALELIEELWADYPENTLLIKYRDHTNKLLSEVEEIWKAEWAAKGQDPPTEQRLEDTYVAAGVREEIDEGEKVREGDLVSSETLMEQKWGGELSLRTKSKGKEREGKGEGEAENAMQD